MITATQIHEIVTRLVMSSTAAIALLTSPAAYSETYFYHNDHLGTPQALSDSSKKVAWEVSQKPFGESDITTNSVVQNIRFPGQYEDLETGLSYNYFRTYDQSTGRYTQNDPIGLSGGLSRFGYVSGNPVNRTDVYGLKDWGIGGGACCNYSSVDQWAVTGGTSVDGTGKWTKLPPRSCTSFSTDCDGTTCGGGFYRSRNILNKFVFNAVSCFDRDRENPEEGQICNVGDDERWTPEVAGSVAQSPLLKGVNTGNAPPRPSYPWAQK